MKNMIYLLVGFFVITAHAYDLKLEQFDQEKLADLMGRLPLTVRTRVITQIEGPVAGLSVKSEFPKADVGFKAVCESKYYNNSPYASSSVCTMTVDEQHPNLDTKYDEYLLKLEDAATAAALFKHISYGKPEKDFRSFGKDKGLTFEGKTAFIFHYRFKCREESCVLNFSQIIGRDDDHKLLKNRIY